MVFDQHAIARNDAHAVDGLRSAQRDVRRSRCDARGFRVESLRHRIDIKFRFAIVPSEVSEEAVTPAASVLPLSVPAGAITAAVLIEVVRPLALIVTIGIAVELPVVPAVATVASVPAAVTLPVPSKLGEV